MPSQDVPPETPAQHTRAASRLDRLTSPAGLVLSAFLLAIVMPVTSAVRDPDFWWHLRAGQIMQTTHTLIATDPFTYTVSDHHWTMHEWATEVSFAVMHAVGGLGLIVVVMAVITWLGLIAVYLRARADMPGPVVAGVGMLAAALAGYPVWGPRVQMLTFALVALVMLLTDRHLRGGGRLIWVLVPVFTVWSNFHSGFVGGIAFMIVMAVADLAGHRLRWPGSAPPRRAVTVLLVALACTAAAMINPNGPGIVLYPFATVGSAVQQAVILEWHSPSFHMFEIGVLFAPMFFSLLLFIIINRSIRARDAALVVVTIALTLQSIRNLSLFVAGCTPVWITQADMLLRRRRERRGPRRPAVLPPLALRVPVYITVMAVVAGAVALRAATPLAVAEDSIAYAWDYPVCAVRWLETAPPGLTMFNQYGEGGYLAYRLAARGDRIFVFGDAALMGDQLLVDYGSVANMAWDWDAILARHNTDLVLFDTGEPITNVLEHSARWTRVYSDSRTEAFARSDTVAALHLPPAPPASADPHDVCNVLNSESAPGVPRGGPAPG